MHGLRLGKVLGIELRLDWSVLLILWLLTWLLATDGLPTIAPGYTDGAYWLAGMASAIVFLGSLVAHEMSHSIVAARHGLVVRDITLWLFGGVARIEAEPRAPRDDFAIAAAGPLMSFAIAFLALAGAGIFHLLGVPGIVVGCAAWLGSINFVLGVFNLAPAAPLDGGRLLRAWLWHRSGDRTAAALKATHAGEVFAWFLITFGVLEFAAGAGVQGLWMVVLGWVVLTAARAEGHQTMLTEQLGGIRVGDVMTAHPSTAPQSITVTDFLVHYVMSSRCSAFPIVDASGRVTGLVTLARCKDVPAAARDTTLVSEIAWQPSELTLADPDELLAAVLSRMQGGDGRILVFRGDDLVGIVTPTDVTRTVQRSGLVRR
ncbi:MAG TPA: site-2 protease family protein [Acidimicrobiia bacterium]|nr:site-2 protease family protein [Acidimicrobiia bacterium]